jgi:hypothetical protein
VIIAAAATSEVLAISAAPFVPMTVLKTLLYLTFPFALVAAIGACLVAQAVPGRRSADGAAGPERLRDTRAAGRTVAATAAAVLAWLGVYAANCLTIYGPFDVATYVFHAITLAAAVGLFHGARRILGAASSMASWVSAVRMTEAQGRSVLLLVLGVLSLAADVFIFPSGYFRLHEAFWAAGGTLIAAAAVTSLLRHRSVSLVGTCVLLVGAQLHFAGRATTVALDARFLALGSLISHRAFLQTVWRLSDRDGDGFSAFAGGSDCDDDDALAFPLSRGGRDCLGLRGPSTATPAPAPTPALPLALAPPLPWPAGGQAGDRFAHPLPRVILLLTIDAFRCGFGQLDAPDLRDACPELMRLARQGRLRLDGHTSAPQTRWAIGSLLTSRYPPFVSGSRAATTMSLPRRFARLGYWTSALPTCRYASIAPGVDQFDEIDASLVPLARDGAAISAPDVNRAILRRVAASRSPGGRPLFLWTHYMDPHAPYLRDAGTRWVGVASTRRNYVTEIRRTDQAIGELVRALASSADTRDVVVFITADHGEELGEHGLAFHGAQVYEESTRIPMLAWSTASASADPARLRLLPEPLPGSLTEVADYLEAAVTGHEFLPSSTAVSWAPLTGSVSIVEGFHKVILFPKLGLLQIFELDRDPNEHADLGSGRRLPLWVEPLARALLAQAPWLPAPQPP